MKKRYLMIIVVAFSGLLAENLRAFEFETGWADIDIHGFISQGYLQSNRNNYYANTDEGTFQFNELGINFSTELSDHLRAGLQLFSRDLGDIGNNDVVLDWAFGDYRWKDWLGLRAGKIKIPYGFYNYTRDLDMLRTSILLPQAVYHEVERDLLSALYGIGLYGYLPLASLGSVKYQFQYGETNIDPDGGTVKQIENLGYRDILSLDPARVGLGHIEWQMPLEGLRLGGTLLDSSVEGQMATTSHPLWASQGIPAGLPMSYELDDVLIRVLSAEYVWDDLILSAEHLAFNFDEVTGELLRQTNTMEGYYGSVSYRFTEWLELGAYYSVFYFDKNDKDGQKMVASGRPDYYAWQKEFVLSSRFDINESWLVKLEGHFIDGTALMFMQDNLDGADQNSFLLALKTTFNF